MERRTERLNHDRGRWSEIEYLGDLEDGLWTVFRKDGSRDWARQYVAGVQQGYQRSWTTTGELLEEKWFRDGQLHGTWRVWDAAGVLRQESHFLEGEPEGLQLNWDEQGQLIARGTITDGLRDGTFVIDLMNAEETASKRMVVEFRAGKLISDLGS
jgi:antitoxin component YwqK of YwqJK toxin-antitoxin module